MRKLVSAVRAKPWPNPSLAVAGDRTTCRCFARAWLSRPGFKPEVVELIFAALNFCSISSPASEGSPELRHRHSSFFTWPPVWITAIRLFCNSPPAAVLRRRRRPPAEAFSFLNLHFWKARGTKSLSSIKILFNQIK